MRRGLLKDRRQTKRNRDSPRHGAPSKMTEERIEIILKTMKLYGYLRTAAVQAGISELTLNLWLKKGEEAAAKGDDQDEYYKFLIAFRQAESDGDVRAASFWQAAMKDDWHAAAEWLARRHPQEWSPTRNVRLSGDRKNPVAVEGEVRFTDVLTAMARGDIGAHDALDETDDEDA